jgi:hypothetical protein
LILGPPLLPAPSLEVGCQTNAWPATPGDFAQFLAVLERVRRLGFSGFETSFRNVQDRFDSTGTAHARIGKAGVASSACTSFCRHTILKRRSRRGTC